MIFDTNAVSGLLEDRACDGGAGEPGEEGQPSARWGGGLRPYFSIL
jgi:hypothetical protein